MADENISEFNSNKFVVERINNVIAELNNAFNEDNPNGIIKWERAFLRELWPKLKRKGERDIYKRLYGIVCKAQTIPQGNQISQGIGSGKVIFELEQIALDLMDLADAHGLLMKNKDDPRLAALK